MPGTALQTPLSLRESVSDWSLVKMYFRRALLKPLVIVILFIKWATQTNFKWFLILNSKRNALFVQKVHQFCWIVGFCLLVELHRKGSGHAAKHQSQIQNHQLVILLPIGFFLSPIGDFPFLVLDSRTKSENQQLEIKWPNGDFELGIGVFRIGYWGFKSPIPYPKNTNPYFKNTKW